MKTLLLANRLLLEQACGLIASMSLTEYTQPFPEFESGSIGQHFRHVLDHYQALLAMSDSVDYDLRHRGSNLERNQCEALGETQHLLQQLGNLEDQPVFIRSETSPDERRVVEAKSSVKRELMFVTSHAIHHFALIAALMRMQGMAVPKEFGVAPATLTYQRQAMLQV